jgi:hypothetical protein
LVENRAISQRQLFARRRSLDGAAAPNRLNRVNLSATETIAGRYRFVLRSFGMSDLIGNSEFQKPIAGRKDQELRFRRSTSG